MSEVSVTFQGPNWFHVRTQMYEALGLDHPAQPSTASDFPDYEDGADPGEPEPDPVPVPSPAPKRSHKKAVAPAPTPDLAPASPPTPTQEPARPARNLPATDVLKAIVTQAVRLAQKKEGPTKILELLPEFKTRTGLGFVMEATDAHREALGDLIDAAGLAEAVA
jgi:hypothetical protein